MPTTITIKNASAHEYGRILDVLNEEFGKGYKGFQSCACPVAKDAIVWCPTLADKDNCGNHAGWRNVISDDGMEIVTECIGDDAGKKEKNAQRHAALAHITFARSGASGPFRFIGVFRLVETGPRVYRRIATEVTIDGRTVTWPTD